ncbi:MAG: hypothetical protein K2I62_03065 [Alistipes sp.]|nr:hypothetical protein [Alistipes sp.]
MYPVSTEFYRQVAARLSEAVGGRGYYSGSIEGETSGAAWRLTVSVIVYRSRLSQPEGVSEPVSDFVPVWWEFHTFVDGSELLNDFSFARLREIVKNE